MFPELFLRLAHQVFDLPVEFLRVRRSLAEIADDALMVDEDDRGERSYAPRLGDRAALTAVPERPPGDGLSLRLAQRGNVRVGVDADQDERATPVLLDERPLVREHFPAVRSPHPPEAQHHHLAAVV